MALSLSLHRQNVGSTVGDTNSLDVSITPEVAPSLESMSALVLPPVAEFLGDLGTSQITTLDIDASNPSPLRRLAYELGKPYIDGLKRIEAAAKFVDDALYQRASKDYEESLLVMLRNPQATPNDSSSTLLALGA